MCANYTVTRRILYTGSEGMFLGVFRNDFKRYSPARRLYLSSFTGEEGDETSLILR